MFRMRFTPFANVHPCNFGGTLSITARSKALHPSNRPNPGAELTSIDAPAPIVRGLFGVTPLTPASLLAIAEGLARSSQIGGTELTDFGRGYRHLIHTEKFEAWIIAWAPSSFLGLHDHGGSSGAFRVLEGVLTEVSTDTVTGGPLATARFGARDQRSFEPTHVHEIWNEGERLAVSVHVYSPPLSHMNFFGHQSTDFLQLLRTESREDWARPDKKI
jgi:hypothetical protein